MLDEEVRETPRISVNKLGEYMDASVVRRHNIIRDQKYPPDFKPLWYPPARRTIVEFIEDGGSDEEILQNKIEELSREAEKEDESFQSRRAGVCVEALQTFRRYRKMLVDASGLDVEEAGHTDKMQVGGVNISVYPDLLVRGRGTQIGLIKLYFGKTHPLNDESGEYVANILRWYADRYVASEEEEVNRDLCEVVDVMDIQTYSAPRHYKRRNKELTFACHEIARQWPALQK